MKKCLLICRRERGKMDRGESVGVEKWVVQWYDDVYLYQKQKAPITTLQKRIENYLEKLKELPQESKKRISSSVWIRPQEEGLYAHFLQGSSTFMIQHGILEILKCFDQHKRSCPPLPLFCWDGEKERFDLFMLELAGEGFCVSPLRGEGCIFQPSKETLSLETFVASFEGIQTSIKSCLEEINDFDENIQSMTCGNLDDKIEKNSSFQVWQKWKVDLSKELLYLNRNKLQDIWKKGLIEKSQIEQFCFYWKERLRDFNEKNEDIKSFILEFIVKNLPHSQSETEDVSLKREDTPASVHSSNKSGGEEESTEKILSRAEEGQRSFPLVPLPVVGLLMLVVGAAILYKIASRHFVTSSS